MHYLNNWTILENTVPGGKVVMRLRGQVFGHPYYEPGCDVVISVLRSCSRDGDSISITTRTGSEYVLGKPNPAEPNAIDRVVRHLLASK